MSTATYTRSGRRVPPEIPVALASPGSPARAGVEEGEMGHGARRKREEEGASDRIVLSAPEAGDLGWVVHRHGALYSAEFGWDWRFEGLVAGVVADFVARFDAARERGWVARLDGRFAGSVFLVSHPERDGVARLRLLLVEPFARGLGIGGRLVAECSRFARAAGYHTITLWTNSVLDDARRLYEREGYRLVHEDEHDDFGPMLTGQTWELAL
jgi:GNAT superfamily N-acetyltransferase